MSWTIVLQAVALAGSGQCLQDAPRTLADIIAADNQVDLDRVMQFYTADVVWLPPARPALRGLAAIRQSYAAMYSEFRPHLTSTADETKVGDGVARVVGTTGGWLEPRAGGSNRQVTDGYEAVLLCESGAWKVSSLRWWPRQNSAAPAK